MKEFLGLLYQTRQPAECFGGRERGTSERRRAETCAAMNARFAAHGQLAGILHGRLRVSQNKFRRAVNFAGGGGAQKQKTSGATIVHPKSKNGSMTNRKF